MDQPLQRAARVVGLAGPAAQRQQTEAFGSGDDLALDRGTDADDVIGVERETLAVGLQRARAAQGDVYLLLAKLLGTLGEHRASQTLGGVVVLGVFVGAGAELDNRDANRPDPWASRDTAHRAPLKEAFDGIDLVFLGVGHTARPPIPRSQ